MQKAQDLPMLSDEQRTARFFELLPESYFLTLITLLTNSRFFPRDASLQLSMYEDYIELPTTSFESPILNDAFHEFNNTFTELNHFLATNFFVEGYHLVLHPEIKRTDKYERLKLTLDSLCENALEGYSFLAKSLSGVAPLVSEANTFVTYSNNQFFYGKLHYAVTAKRNRELIKVLWKLRSIEKRKVKNPPMPLTVLAAQLDETVSAQKVSDTTLAKICEQIKDMNRNLRKKNMPVEIKITDNEVQMFCK
jgi:hypothetical protein